jgi:FKBP-type peptidyl-prolyl cis-trans isomerase SlyD
MAGQTLVFDVEITGVRQATEQELEHGHIHHGGHDH